MDSDAPSREPGWVQVELAALEAITNAAEAKALADAAVTDDSLTYNRVSQVYFRAGLLACREYMARFVEQGGDASTAASIRANWWPTLSDDPGAPRQLAFDEITEGGDEGPWTHREMNPSIEALPYAWAFLVAPPTDPNPQGES